MYQNAILEPIPSQLRLSLNIENVDSLFPGFMFGDFAVLRGSSAVQSFLSCMCVRAQLPYQLGGLETSVLFVDGGSFRLYDVSAFAQTCELDPKEVLERIFVSRAFTAYQLTSLIFENLQSAIEKCDSKIVILSNLAQLFLDDDVPKKEEQEVFLQLTAYLADFAKKNSVILVATHPPRFWSKRSRFFEGCYVGERMLWRQLGSSGIDRILFWRSIQVLSWEKLSFLRKRLLLQTLWRLELWVRLLSLIVWL